LEQRTEKMRADKTRKRSRGNAKAKSAMKKGRSLAYRGTWRQLLTSRLWHLKINVSHILNLPALGTYHTGSTYTRCVQPFELTNIKLILQKNKTRLNFRTGWWRNESVQITGFEPSLKPLEFCTSPMAKNKPEELKKLLANTNCPDIAKVFIKSERYCLVVPGHPDWLPIWATTVFRLKIECTK